MSDGLFLKIQRFCIKRNKIYSVIFVNTHRLKLCLSIYNRYFHMHSQPILVSATSNRRIHTSRQNNNTYKTLLFCFRIIDRLHENHTTLARSIDCNTFYLRRTSSRKERTVASRLTRIPYFFYLISYHNCMLTRQ